jgi:hypothetical protein
MAFTLGDRIFYLPSEEVGGLFSDRNAAIINDEGEQEGMAWLSPVLARKKKDLTALIMDRLFVVSCRELHALLSGNRDGIIVREYHIVRAS